MSIIQIKNRFTGEIIFECEKDNNSIKDTVELAIAKKISLQDADLPDATTQQLQLIIRRMATNLYTRNSTENILPDGAAKDEMLAEIDQDFQKDLQELNRLSPEPSITYHEVEDYRNISQMGEQC